MTPTAASTTSMSVLCPQAKRNGRTFYDALLSEAGITWAEIDREDSTFLSVVARVVMKRQAGLRLAPAVSRAAGT